MDVKICHFETGFMVEDIVSQNDDSQQQLMLHVHCIFVTKMERPRICVTVI